MARKRRQSEAFAPESVVDSKDAAQDGVLPCVDINGDISTPGEESAELDAAQLEKAEEIWTALKEEFHETVEQLPLSLHRSYDLMKELERQVQSFNSEMLSTLHAYVQLRNSLVTKAAEQVAQATAEDDLLPQVVTTENSAMDMEPETMPRSSGQPSQSPQQLTAGRTPEEQEPLTSPLPSRQTTVPPATPAPARAAAQTLPSRSTPALYAFSPARFPPGTPGAVPLPEDRKRAPRKTHELLSHVAWLSEETVRAAEEKVNLANAAYDLTDRHIRLLDQAIKEQETALSIGLRPGTHPTSIVLPELVIPQTSRGHRKQPADATAPEPVAEVSAGSGRPSTGLKITLPATGSTSEEQFCFCNGPSFGVMIACESGFCEREWFHFDCVGLKSTPPGEWICAACLEAPQGNKRLPRRRRR